MTWQRETSISVTGMIHVERSCSVKADRKLWQSAGNRRGHQEDRWQLLEERSGAELRSDLFFFFNWFLSEPPLPQGGILLCSIVSHISNTFMYFHLLFLTGELPRSGSKITSLYYWALFHGRPLKHNLFHSVQPMHTPTDAIHQWCAEPVQGKAIRAVYT